MITFAVIGCGHIGKRHAEMIRRHPEAELRALVDIRPREELGLPIEVVPFYPSLDAFLQTDKNTAVAVIATPNGLHAEQALACLEAGKHVVIEKPMALRKADAEKILFRALHVGKMVFCVMQNRYSPPAVWIRELIDQKILGRINMVQLNCYWNRDERYYTPGSWHGSLSLDGGPLFTQFSHFIDMMHWLFGDVEDIRARFAKFDAGKRTEFEDSGMIHFQFQAGFMGCIQYSTSVWDRNMESSMTVIAENGTVKIGGQYMDKVEYCHVKNYSVPELPPTNPGNDYGAYTGSAQNHHLVTANVVDVLKNRASIAVNALEGLKTVDIIERIYAARYD